MLTFEPNHLEGTMSGHNAGRPRRWPWAVLSFLFAMTFAFAFAQVGGVWSIIRIGSAVGLGISLLVLVLKSISSRRHRRAQEGDETAEMEPEGQPSEEQPPEDRVRTYEEVFGLQTNLDAEGLPAAPEDQEWPSDEGPEMEPEGQPSAELPAEEPVFTSEDDAQSLEADLEEEVDQVEALDADGSQEDLRRMREEFRARAEEAALRVKQREAELQEAASVADQER
jgi:hypothetical protein